MSSLKLVSLQLRSFFFFQIKLKLYFLTFPLVVLQLNCYTGWADIDGFLGQKERVGRDVAT